MILAVCWVVVILALDLVPASLVSWLPASSWQRLPSIMLDHDSEFWNEFFDRVLVWVRRLLLVLSTLAIFLSYVGLFVVCAGLQCLGWFGAGSVKAFIVSLAFSSGQLIPLLGALEWTLPGAAKAPLVLAGAAFFACGNGLRAVGWHTQGRVRRMVSLFAHVIGVFMPIVGLIEWKNPGFLLARVMPCSLFLLLFLLGWVVLLVGFREDCAAVRALAAPVLGMAGFALLAFGNPWSAIAGSREVGATLLFLTVAEWMFPGLVTAPPVFIGAGLLVTGIALREHFGSSSWTASILGVFVAILGVVGKVGYRVFSHRAIA